MKELFGKVLFVMLAKNNHLMSFVVFLFCKQEKDGFITLILCCKL